MCGRYTLRQPRGHPWLAEADSDLGAPRFNIAPSQAIAVVGRDRWGGRVVRKAAWGFRPRWLPGDRKAPINARAEGVAEKPLFRRAFRQGRCLVPADGWYEWQTQSDGPKQPWFIHRPDDAVFWLAGLATANAEGTPTVAIVTRPAAAPLAEIHPRMPAVLADDAAAQIWLDSDPDNDDPKRALFPEDDNCGLVARPVSRAVNRPDNDGPTLVEPLAE